jgi:sortase A
LDSERRRLTAKAASIAGLLACVVGAGLLIYPYYTDYSATEAQQSLARNFDSREVKIAYETKEIPISSPVTRLKIQKLGVDTIVVEGTTEEALKTGAGHYPETPLPGQKGNVAIAGHRTTYGKPFHDLDQLAPGDTAVLETPTGRFTYRMVPGFDGHSNPWVVAPTDFSVVAPTPKPMLTLTTCHPKGSARQRLIARFELVE